MQYKFDTNLYFIAEIGVNHAGNIDLAKKMIQEISASGAHAAKFQTYKAEKLAHSNSPAYWDQNEEPTKTQYDLFKKFDAFEKKDYIELAEECLKYNIDFISTPFDVDCLSWLMPLMPVVKIASADLTNHLLLIEVAKYNKPMILSVGAASDNEIDAAVELLCDHGVKNITLLHCMLLYPTPKRNAYLSRIQYLINKYKEKNIIIGYSDHVKPSEANNDQLVAAFAMGARVIEKHYTHNKNLKGNDHYHSLDKQDLKNTMVRLNDLKFLISSEKKFKESGLEDQESAINHARRSLFYRTHLNAGHILSSKDLISKRPGSGVSPDKIEKILGRTLTKNVEKDQNIDFGHLS